MKRVKVLVKKYGFPLAFFIILALGIPLLINIAFKCNWGISWLQAEWKAGEALSFYGSILGAVVAIAGVKWTIENTLKSQETERILQAKPCLSTDTYLVSTAEYLKNLDDGNTWFIYRYGHEYGVVKGIPSRIDLKKYTFNANECIISYKISNIGVGSATEINFQLDSLPIFMPFTLPVNSIRVFVLILPLKAEEIESEYGIRFTYGDIVSNIKYEQHEVLRIMKDENGITFKQNLSEMLTMPKEEKNTNGTYEI